MLQSAAIKSPNHLFMAATGLIKQTPGTAPEQSAPVSRITCGYATAGYVKTSSFISYKNSTIGE
jgi:hypothetical protein